MNQECLFLITAIEEVLWEILHYGRLKNGMSDLARKHCVPCEGGTLPLTNDQEEDLMRRVDSSWTLFRGQSSAIHRLRKQFKFKHFKEAMVFVNKIAEIAEAEGHHPDISLSYNKVRIDLYTHAVKGLSENDFILAAKIDRAFLAI